MLNFRSLAATALLGTSALMLAAAPASAAGCHAANGQFTKCPPTATASKTGASKTTPTAGKPGTTTAMASMPTTVAKTKAHPTK